MLSSFFRGNGAWLDFLGLNRGAGVYFVVTYRRYPNGILYEQDIFKAETETDAIAGALTASRHYDGAMAVCERTTSRGYSKTVLKTFGAVWD